MSAASKVAKAVRKYGRTMLLRRRVGTTSSYTDVPVRAISEGYKPDELVGGLQQGDRHVTFTNDELSKQSAFVGPPKKGDFIVVDGVQTAIQGVETMRLGDDVLAHVAWVRG